MATTAKRPGPNPLRAGLRVGGASEPTVFVIYGASGDLSQRKLLPAIYNLAVRGLLPSRFAVVGYARSEMDNDGFREFARAARREVLANAGRRPPVAGVRRDAPLPVGQLRRGRLQGAGRAARGDRRRPRDRREPGVLPVHAGQLLPRDRPDHGGDQAQPAARVRAGRDREAVRPRPGLGPGAGRCRCTAPSDENQIYRIDHYLGKETVQNIFVFRFANAIFEPVWNNTHVDHVQITVGESIGVEHRAAFYEETGVRARHRAEPPPPGARAGRDGAAGGVRRRRRSATRRPRFCVPRGRSSLENSVRGQYGEGYVAGEKVAGYLDEPNVPPDSNTPTYIAAKLEIDNWRWAGTPFYIRAGKRLAQARHRGGGAVQAPAAPAVPDRRGRAASSRTRSSFASSPTRASRSASEPRRPRRRSRCGR